MSSSVFFKFKSQKDPRRVTFDGTGISVFELKRDIISISGLGDGTDFDLAIYNPDTNEEYGDDTAVVSRGTTVVARRLPASKPGAGRAARYVSGKMPVAAKNQHRIEASRSTATTKSTPAVEVNNAMTEEERIAAMFQAGGEQWEQQQQQMANQKAVHRSGGFQKPNNVPDKPLPPGYTCHRCGEKGHWIQACPTNNDPNFDGRPKFRRTTGIPRSFLKVVEKPTALTSDGTVDVSQLPAGVMYTSTGEWVVAEPDKASWERFQEKTKASAEKAEAAATENQELRDRGLECPIDKRLFVDPMKTPCCGKTYCRDCIENTLLGNDFVCPGCSSDGVLVDNLISDEDVVGQIKAYEEEKSKAKLERKKSASPLPEQVKSPSKEPSKEDTKKSESPKPATSDNRAASQSATPQPAAAAASETKKRPAEHELENPRIPTGPAAMRKQQSASQTLVPGNMADFAQHMNALAGGSVPGGQAGMNAFAPQMMGFPNMMGMPMNPMMMGMGMGNPMMNGGWNGNNNMGFMNGMNGMPGMNGMNFPQANQRQQYNNNNNNSNGGGFNPMMNNAGYGQQWNNGNQGWNMGNGNGMAMQQQQQQQQQQNPGDEDAYFRKPVNPQRHQARNRRQRSVDYREM